MKRTQAFLVMGFIIAAALAIGFFTQMREERDTRTRVEKMLSSVMKERDDIQFKMNAEVLEKEKQISYLTASLRKETIINARLAQNLDRSCRRFAIASRDKKPVELEKIIVSSLLEAEGRVLAVDKQNDLVVINMDLTNNLKNGDSVAIYRGDNFIASAQLIKVQDRISAAMVLPADNNKDIQVEINDTIK